jgi:hypothetical protein
VVKELFKLIRERQDKKAREARSAQAVHTATLMVFNKRINATQERRAA